MSAMDIDTHPNPTPNPHHRKIDLQSPHDLTYLQTNLANSALQKLDLHFPKISKPATHISLGATTPQDQRQETTSKDEDEDDEEDPMRRRVHDLITEFLHTTWTSANHNISVNGIDAAALSIPHTATLSAAPASTRSDPSADGNVSTREDIEGLDFHYAPFDASLQRKLASLHGELEALTAQVSKLRRTAPGQGAEINQARLEAALRADDERFDADMSEVAGRNIEGLNIDGVREGWNEDVRDVYERGVGMLASLAGVGSGSGEGVGPKQPSLTETVGKAQRARTVALEME